jgi:hypothetical protein
MTYDRWRFTILIRGAGDVLVMMVAMLSRISDGSVVMMSRQLVVL